MQRCFTIHSLFMDFRYLYITWSIDIKLENVFVKHYAPNHMPDPKGEWSLKENNSELHYGNIQKLISPSTPWFVTICQISGSYPKQFFTRLFLYKMPASEKVE